DIDNLICALDIRIIDDKLEEQWLEMYSNDNGLKKRLLTLRIVILVSQQHAAHHHTRRLLLKNSTEIVDGQLRKYLDDMDGYYIPHEAITSMLTLAFFTTQVLKRKRNTSTVRKILNGWILYYGRSIKLGPNRSMTKKRFVVFLELSAHVYYSIPYGSKVYDIANTGGGNPEDNGSSKN
ncbi:hypothetical protein ACJX0J_033914, partial [Zea mays]